MRYLVTLFAVAAFSSPAFCEDMTPRVDEESGNWISGSFQDGPETKICFAGSSDRKIMLRADDSDLELRSSNDDWSLSADATGDITIKVGNVTKVVHMHTFDSKTLAGDLDPGDLTEVMDAMDKSATASVTFGSKKPISISLSGSTRVLNAFRTCAAVHGFAKLGGSAGSQASPF